MNPPHPMPCMGLSKNLGISARAPFPRPPRRTMLTAMVHRQNSLADRPLARDETREFLLGPPLAVALLAAAAGILLLAGLALWQRHGLLVYVDMLATGIWNCF